MSETQEIIKRLRAKLSTASPAVLSGESKQEYLNLLNTHKNDATMLSAIEYNLDEQLHQSTVIQERPISSRLFSGGRDAGATPDARGKGRFGDEYLSDLPIWRAESSIENILDEYDLFLPDIGKQTGRGRGKYRQFTKNDFKRVLKIITAPLPENLKTLRAQTEFVIEFEKQLDTVVKSFESSADKRGRPQTDVDDLVGARAVFRDYTNAYLSKVQGYAPDYGPRSRPPPSTSAMLPDAALETVKFHEREQAKYREPDLYKKQGKAVKRAGKVDVIRSVKSLAGRPLSEELLTLDDAGNATFDDRSLKRKLFPIWNKAEHFAAVLVSMVAYQYRKRDKMGGLGRGGGKTLPAITVSRVQELMDKLANIGVLSTAQIEEVQEITTKAIQATGVKIGPYTDVGAIKLTGPIKDTLYRVLVERNTAALPSEIAKAKAEADLAGGGSPRENPGATTRYSFMSPMSKADAIALVSRQNALTLRTFKTEFERPLRPDIVGSSFVIDLERLFKRRVPAAPSAAEKNPYQYEPNDIMRSTDKLINWAFMVSRPGSGYVYLSVATKQAELMREQVSAQQRAQDLQSLAAGWRNIIKSLVPYVVYKRLNNPALATVPTQQLVQFYADCLTRLQKGMPEEARSYLYKVKDPQDPSKLVDQIPILAANVDARVKEYTTKINAISDPTGDVLRVFNQDVKEELFEYGLFVITWTYAQTAIETAFDSSRIEAPLDFTDSAVHGYLFPSVNPSGGSACSTFKDLMETFFKNVCKFHNVKPSSTVQFPGSIVESLVGTSGRPGGIDKKVYDLFVYFVENHAQVEFQTNPSYANATFFEELWGIVRAKLVPPSRYGVWGANGSAHLNTQADFITTNFYSPAYGVIVTQRSADIVNVPYYSYLVDIMQVVDEFDNLAAQISPKDRIKLKTGYVSPKFMPLGFDAQQWASMSDDLTSSPEGQKLAAWLQTAGVNVTHFYNIGHNRDHAVAVQTESLREAAAPIAPYLDKCGEYMFKRAAKQSRKPIRGRARVRDNAEEERDPTVDFSTLETSADEATPVDLAESVEIPPVDPSLLESVTYIHQELNAPAPQVAAAPPDFLNSDIFVRDWLNQCHDFSIVIVDLAAKNYLATRFDDDAQDTYLESADEFDVIGPHNIVTMAQAYRNFKLEPTTKTVSGSILGPRDPEQIARGIDDEDAEDLFDDENEPSQQRKKQRSMARPSAFVFRFFYEEIHDKNLPKAQSEASGGDDAARSNVDDEDDFWDDEDTWSEISAEPRTGLKVQFVYPVASEPISVDVDDFDFQVASAVLGAPLAEFIDRNLNAEYAGNDNVFNRILFELGAKYAEGYDPYGGPDFQAAKERMFKASSRHAALINADIKTPIQYWIQSMEEPMFDSEKSKPVKARLPMDVWFLPYLIELQNSAAAKIVSGDGAQPFKPLDPRNAQERDKAVAFLLANMPCYLPADVVRGAARDSANRPPLDFTSSIFIAEDSELVKDSQEQHDVDPSHPVYVVDAAQRRVDLLAVMDQIAVKSGFTNDPAIFSKSSYANKPVSAIYLAWLLSGPTKKVGALLKKWDNDLGKESRNMGVAGHDHGFLHVTTHSPGANGAARVVITDPKDANKKIFARKPLLKEWSEQTWKRNQLSANLRERFGTSEFVPVSTSQSVFTEGAAEMQTDDLESPTGPVTQLRPIRPELLDHVKSMAPEVAKIVDASRKVLTQPKLWEAVFYGTDEIVRPAFNAPADLREAISTLDYKGPNKSDIRHASAVLKLQAPLNFVAFLAQTMVEVAQHVDQAGHDFALTKYDSLTQKAINENWYAADIVTVANDTYWNLLQRMFGQDPDDAIAAFDTVYAYADEALRDVKDGKGFFYIGYTFLNNFTKALLQSPTSTAEFATDETSSTEVPDLANDLGSTDTEPRDNRGRRGRSLARTKHQTPRANRPGSMLPPIAPEQRELLISLQQGPALIIRKAVVDEAASKAAGTFVLQDVFRSAVSKLAKRGIVDTSSGTCVLTDKGSLAERKYVQSLFDDKTQAKNLLVAYDKLVRGEVIRRNMTEKFGSVIKNAALRVAQARRGAGSHLHPEMLIQPLSSATRTASSKAPVRSKRAKSARTKSASKSTRRSPPADDEGRSNPTGYPLSGTPMLRDMYNPKTQQIETVEVVEYRPQVYEDPPTFRVDPITGARPRQGGNGRYRTRKGTPYRPRIYLPKDPNHPTTIEFMERVSIPTHENIRAAIDWLKRSQNKTSSHNPGSTQATTYVPGTSDPWTNELVPKGRVQRGGGARGVAVKGAVLVPGASAPAPKTAQELEAEKRAERVANALNKIASNKPASRITVGEQTALLESFNDLESDVRNAVIDYYDRFPAQHDFRDKLKAAVGLSTSPRVVAPTTSAPTASDDMSAAGLARIRESKINDLLKDIDYWKQQETRVANLPGNDAETLSTKALLPRIQARLAELTSELAAITGDKPVDRGPSKSRATSVEPAPVEGPAPARGRSVTTTPATFTGPGGVKKRGSAKPATAEPTAPAPPVPPMSPAPSPAFDESELGFARVDLTKNPTNLNVEIGLALNQIDADQPLEFESYKELAKRLNEQSGVAPGRIATSVQHTAALADLTNKLAPSNNPTVEVFQKFVTTDLYERIRAHATIDPATGTPDPDATNALIAYLHDALKILRAPRANRARLNSRNNGSSGGYNGSRF